MTNLPLSAEFIAEADVRASASLEDEYGPLGRKLERIGIAIDAIKDRVASETIRKFGRLDGAFNNAGVEQSWRRLHELDEAQWRRVLDINLTGIFLS